MNTRHEVYKRFDRHFDVHHPKDILYNKPYIYFLKRNESKVWLTQKIAGLENVNVIDKRGIMSLMKDVDKTGKMGEFFTSSFPWMIGQAILEGYEEIGVFGVDLDIDSERQEQKPSAVMWMGFAAGLGIKLFYPNNCRLFAKKRLYWQ